jgi:hypothetical protein
MADAIGYMLSPHPRLDLAPKDVGSSILQQQSINKRINVAW